MILIVTQCFPPTPGGIEGLMGGLARELAAAGRQVLVLADADTGSDAYDASLPDLLTVRRYGGLKPLRRYLKARAAMKLVRGGGVEGVFADSWKSLEKLDGAALKRAGVPVIVWAHGMEFPQQTTGGKAERIASSLSLADKIIANSRFTAGRVSEFLPGAENIEIRHPPIDAPTPPTRDDLKKAKAVWGVGAPRLLCLARLEPRKGVDRVLHALSEIKGAYPNIRFVIAGGGGDLDRLETLAADLGVKDRVVFAGRVSDAEKNALYATADLFVMPTRAEGASVEGFGIVYLEAAYFGAPSVAGKAGGVADAVVDGETGVLCDGADQASVTEALLGVLSDPDLRAELSRKAKIRGEAALWPNSISLFLDDLA